MGEITLADIIDVLGDVDDTVDFGTARGLVSGGVLDSFGILQVINAIDEEFDVAIPAKDITPANFDSAQAIHALVCRLADED